MFSLRSRNANMDSQLSEVKAALEERLLCSTSVVQQGLDIEDPYGASAARKKDIKCHICKRRKKGVEEEKEEKKSQSRYNKYSSAYSFLFRRSTVTSLTILQSRHNSQCKNKKTTEERQSLLKRQWKIFSRLLRPIIPVIPGLACRCIMTEDHYTEHQRHSVIAIDLLCQMCLSSASLQIQPQS